MNNKRRLLTSALSLGLGMTLWGCSTDTPSEQPYPGNIPTPAVGGVAPKFNPIAGDPSQLPLPNDLLRDPNPGPTQGLVNQIPNTPPFDAEPFTSLKSMRGFSTTGNIIIPFDGQIAADSVTADSILLVEGAPQTDAAEADFTNTTIPCNIAVSNGEGGGSAANSTVTLQPVLPLKPFRNYFVVIKPSILAGGAPIGSPKIPASGTTPALDIARLTRSQNPLVDGNGNSLIYPADNATAQRLEGLRQFYQPLWARAEQITGLQRSEIPFVFRFGTQPLFAALPQLRAATAASQTDATKGLLNSVPGNFPAAGAPNPVTPAQFFTAQSIPAPATGIGRIFVGNITATNYISDPTTGFFQGSGLPGDPIQPQGTKALPFLVCLPTVNPGDPPVPAVIFQHGITRSKEDIFALASTLNSAGIGVIAIDLPLHGSQALFPGDPARNGEGFINLASLRTSRDNIRQSAVNLFHISNAIVSGFSDLDGVTGPEFLPAPPGYLGQSLGGIVGSVYTSTDPLSRTAVLNVAGGRITDLLLNSNSISPQILAGLEAQGLTPGSEAFSQFFLIAQTVVDDADPMNYAAPALTGALKGGSANASRVLLQEAVGDLVVPNTATRDLARAFAQFPGFRHILPAAESVSLVSTQAGPFNGSGYFQFPGAQHGVLLTPAQGNTAAVRFQALTFLGSGFTQPTPTIVDPFPTFPNPKSLESGPVFPYSINPKQAITF